VFDSGAGSSSGGDGSSNNSHSVSVGEIELTQKPKSEHKMPEGSTVSYYD
jgi:hypothetical protein